MRFKRDFIHVQKDKNEKKSKYSHYAGRTRGGSKYRDRYGEEAARKAEEEVASEKEKLEQRIIDAALEKAEMEAAAAAETAARLAAEAAAQAEMAAREAEIAAEKLAREAEIAAEKLARETAAAAETAARLAAEAAALLDRDDIAAEVTAKALQSQNERDQLFEVSQSIYMSENQHLGESSLSSITPRAAGDPYWIDDDYDENNDTYLYTDNIAIGNWALSQHTKPIQTIAIGAYSQENSIYDAAHDGTDPANPYNIGNRNVSVGAFTLRDNTTGASNTAIGRIANTYNTTGSSNVSVGAAAMNKNTTGWGNISIGAYTSFTNTTGSVSTAVGYTALYTNPDKSYNTALGYRAGYATTQAANTFLGALAGENSTGGWNNTIIGYNAQASSATVANEITLGDSNISNIRCNTTSFSSLSDSRDKAEITNIPEDAGLQFIDKLRPVTFYWDRREWYSDNTSDGSKMNKVHSDETPNSGQRMGFIAQDVLEILNDYKYIKESGMVSESNPEKLEFALGSLVTPLVKAVQQLSEQNKDLLDRITILEEK
jgi:chemotaxis protein histidine kinase CheA